MEAPSTLPPTYGLAARFATPQELLEAIEETRARGYEQLDAYTPFPIEEVNEEVAHHKKSPVSKLVLAAGLTGAAVGFGMQWWISAVDYPLNIGGRPLLSWPAFIPVTFEVTVLFAAFTAAIGMIALNRLPEPYHPVFGVPGFERASIDRYFLVIESADPRFDAAGTRAFLAGLGAEEVHDVAW